ncbi:MAG TPA: isoprenylcysteine carboxylmethyltransferase family protein [Anaerolineales bacterium]|nr:isoprenylcysteine carboxylmethyltransferase family protein [Anaerolineales bacterium]
MTTGGFILSSLITVVIFPAVILFVSGDWLWLEGWIFGLWFDAMVLSNMIYLFRNDPALLAERSKAPGSDNQKPWDKYLLTGAYIMAFMWYIIMPLDAKRFAWSPDFPLWLKVLGGLALIPALYLIYRATVENTYLSTLVRIQADRKQQVISTGVYGFVRHPLYLGCLLMLYGAPLLLGSITGLIIAVIALIGLVGRITGEEKMLSSELEGYQDYQQKVTYRLIPFVW